MVKIFIFILLPLVAFADILWQDNFDSYTVDSDLSSSPYWEKLEPSLYGFKIKIQSDDDKYAWTDTESGIYIASGGANNPNMKVSVKDFTNYSTPSLIQIGVFTRLSTDKNGYVAIYRHQSDSYGGRIYVVKSGSWIILKTVDLGSPVNSISITATGEDPVHISAFFGSTELSFDDSTYKITSGYGGIYGYCIPPYYNRYAYVDDFIEESGTDIEPASLGIVKALFK